MAKVRSLYFGVASLLLAAVASPTIHTPARAEQIAATVNTTVITDGDVKRRVAFMRLRGEKGGQGGDAGCFERQAHERFSLLGIGGRGLGSGSVK